MNLREIAIDYSAPLTSLVPVFQRVFRFILLLLLFYNKMIIVYLLKNFVLNI